MTHLKTVLSLLTTQLKSKGLTIATAESCTGGLIASFLTEISGSSVWFERGFVTYSNESKHELLGVDPTLIQTHGAVSHEVAKAMVIGVLQHSRADVGLAITGIAGPTGGSLEKPVGTVYLAYGFRNQPPQIEHHYFKNRQRQAIRLLSCRHAFLGVLSLLG